MTNMVLHTTLLLSQVEPSSIFVCCVHHDFIVISGSNLKQYVVSLLTMLHNVMNAHSRQYSFSSIWIL